MLPIIAYVTGIAGKQEPLEKMLRELVRITQKEPGCLFYEYYQYATDPLQYVCVERWRSEKDLESHLAAPHIKNFIAERGKLYDTLEIKTLKELRRQA